MSQLIDNSEIILASQSPRRSDLLGLIDKQFTIKPANINENRQPTESAQAYVSRLAHNKANKIATNASRQSIVIGADTIVIHKNNILGKPKTNQDAYEMLNSLNGKTHKVLTAFSVHADQSNTILNDYCETDVKLRIMTSQEIKFYVSTQEPMDKSGGYAIQNKTFQPASPLGGCLANVIGLPLCHLSNALNKFNRNIDPTIADKCQSYLNYDCPISQSVLKR